jgi:CubicO group peptidase (beta-lactamase class C family)
VFSRCVAIVAAFALAGCVSAPKPTPPLRTAGLVTASIDADGRLATHAEGCAAFASDGRTCARPLTGDSLIRVASISKLVVAVGVMRLVEQKKLDLDRDISAYLGFAVRNPAFADEPITLRRLLSHTSSLRDGDGYVIPLGADIETELKNPSHWDADHPPGSYFTYSNFNFGVIATVMEASTGERFDRLVHRLVLKPLRIEGCFNWAACPERLAARAATLYRTGPDETAWNSDGPWVAQVDDLNGRKPVCPVVRADANAPCDLRSYRPGTNGALFSPQGGLRISIKDLAKIAKLILNNGRLGRVRLLKPSSVQAMLAPQWRFDPVQANGETEKASMCAYGLSIQLLNQVRAPDCRDDLFADGRPRAGHLGEAYGLYGGLWIDLEVKRATIYLVTGTSSDPKLEEANHSAFTPLEERIAGALR